MALARAVYQQKAVSLLDDPLAALDPRVAGRVLNDCIVGLLKPRGCILVTHNVGALELADRIYLLQDGQLSACTKGDALAALQADSNDAALDYEAGGSDADVPAAPADTEAHDARKKPTKGDADAAADAAETADGRLVEEEERGIGIVALRVYATYWHAVGAALAVAVLAALLLMQGSRNVSDWWLSHWVTEASKVRVSLRRGACVFALPLLHVPLCSLVNSEMRAKA